MSEISVIKNKTPESTGFWHRLKKDIIKNKYVYILAIPVLLFYLIFHYGPMYGAMIAFKDFNVARGILGSPWVGFKHFSEFINGFYFGRLLKNTLVISLSNIVFGFPAPILLALLLNEVKSSMYKRTVQTVTYFPHFISVMIMCGLIHEFVSADGLINDIIAYFGGERVSMLLQPKMFVPIFVTSGIYHELGWGSIVYLAAISSIDEQLYEAAKIDGAGKLRRMWHITIPGIIPTIVVLLIMRVGRIMSVGYEKVILLYNPAIYETADIISSYVYRRGLQEFSYSASAAVGLFNSVINFLLVILTNKVSRALTETSLW